MTLSHEWALDAMNSFGLRLTLTTLGGELRDLDSISNSRL